MRSTAELSVSAHQALGVAFLERFCRENLIIDPSVTALIDHLWRALTFKDYLAWENEKDALPITGWGGPLPHALTSRLGLPLTSRLASVSEYVTEITLSQSYGAWRPKESYRYLVLTAEAVGTTVPVETPPKLLADHAPAIHGWGEAVPENDLPQWQDAARRFCRSRE